MTRQVEMVEGRDDENLFELDVRIVQRGKADASGYDTYTSTCVKTCSTCYDTCWDQSTWMQSPDLNRCGEL
ncbi:hypothetical protein EPA93_06390 [Ktedonosporobacter rubrisoli]|uniref:Uncharacterized protein n=1 Tax=Ktedonosporobacter rubrisoli TaxID=2509675 RepID=A0A4V0YYB6_KTERU|nr:hypothetical protein [Ktedonosporobacter rubrisoli]QBD75651.1 hypothetical protein EPA93_06390 [Ktedonosporobacter rubrisoli]